MFHPDLLFGRMPRNQSSIHLIATFRDLAAGGAKEPSDQVLYPEFMKIILLESIT
jgi:hypothetical protein